MSIAEIQQYITDKIKLIIFDCDGTLADTENLHLQAWKEIFLNHRYYNQIIKALEQSKGSPARFVLKKIEQEYQIDLKINEIREIKRLKFFDSRNLIKPITDIVNIAQNFYKKIPLVISSGSSLLEVSVTLNQLEIFELFQEIVTSDKGLKPKPNPDIFLYHSYKNNIDINDVIVFEDSSNGINAAINANMKVYDVVSYQLINH